MVNKVAGFIGMETAETMKDLGKDIRIIQLDPRALLEAFDKETTDIMDKGMVRCGIKLHLSENV
ncbi:MAG: NAD-binding protein [Bacillota bacterium]|nr:NAD-binding protein [Bacillota bacterium]